MSNNFFKLITFTIIITLILCFAGLQVFTLIDFTGFAANHLFALAVGTGALIASLTTGLFLLYNPYNITTKKQTLFVGNLAFRASERELRNLFSQCGEVFSIRLMTDKVTRKPRGYGFIEMNVSGAKKALAQLNETEFMGRDLRVSQANEPSRHEN
ncbi:MAG: RNA-binding protein [Gammaproteobacteria bacterium]|nr:RNA-binding protein [Gammaproteobacteria bacterium]